MIETGVPQPLIKQQNKTRSVVQLMGCIEFETAQLLPREPRWHPVICLVGIYAHPLISQQQKAIGWIFQMQSDFFYNNRIDINLNMDK